VSNFDTVGSQALKHKERLFEVIEVLAMNNQIRGESDFVLANPSGQLDFVRV